MMGMLGEYLEILGGGTPSRDVEAYWNGDLPWATVKDLTTMRISETYESITKRGADECATNIVPANTLLISTRMALGRMSITNVPMAFNQDLKALKIIGAIDQDYLFHFLSSKEAYFISRGNGATVKGFKVEDIRSLPFDPPPLPTQRRIAAVLDKAQALVANDKCTLALYDQLARSLFLEMFGDLALNPKKWPTKRIVELCADDNDIKCGPFGTQLQNRDYRKEGVPLWGIKQINSDFTIPTTEFLTPEKAEELDAYSIVRNDIVMSRKGNVGKCALYPYENPGIMHSDVLRIRFDHKRCDPVFATHQLRYSRAVEHQVGLVSSGAIMAGVNVTKLKSIELHVPPMSSQREFTNGIRTIQVQRARAEQSLRQSEALFGSLLQGAFNGEL